VSNLAIRAFRSSLIGTVIMAALIFGPAGTLDYWQGWVFMAVFVIATVIITIYLAIHDPKLLERRMRGGPTAETERSQKIIMLLMLIAFLAMLVVPALDHRFGWSHMPLLMSLIGDALVVIGFFLVFFVVRVNTFAASTVQVSKGQEVISTGPYGLVRHPMYAGSIPLVAGIPIALGSWWGLFALIVFIPGIAWRLLDEERFLRRNLRGYAEYMSKVRYRLVPRVW
jgi:protein-S-isoprenylcysteine O-methyltransferase Ste14